MLVYDEDGEEIGDFREEPYDLSPKEESDFIKKTLLYCIAIAVLVGFVWWVLQSADPALDRLDAMRAK